MAASAEPEETQVLVRFTTALPQELRVPEAEVAVPASLKRYGLSQIINHLLALEPPRPFDFIVDGELVRKSLQQHLLDHSISPETVVEVEYVPAVVPPEPQAAVPQDDWVMALAAAGGSLASGAADGVVRVWSGPGDCQLEFAAHKHGVTALAAVPSSSSGSSNVQQLQHQPALLLSAGKDHALRLWQLTLAGAAAGAKATKGKAAGSRSSASCVAECVGHSDAVQAVAASPAGDACASGGWDGQLLLWRTGPQALPGAAADSDTEAPAAAAGSRKKRRTGAANGSAPGAAPAQLQPLAPLPGHVHCIAALAWPEAGTLFSGGWDHSVRRYDVEAHANTDTYNGSKAVYALAAPAAADAGASSSGSGSSELVAFGGSDRVLRLWDARAAGEALSVAAYAAHEGWIAGVAWRPGSGHHLATSGHDGRVKLWDVRSPVPLASLAQHGDAKALCVAWWGPGALASGGSDCSLQLYRLPS